MKKPQVWNKSEKFYSAPSIRLWRCINNTIDGLHDAGVMSDKTHQDFLNQYMCSFSPSEESMRVWELSDQIIGEYLARSEHTFSVGKHTYRLVSNLSEDTIDKMNFHLKQECKEEGLFCDVRFDTRP